MCPAYGDLSAGANHIRRQSQLTPITSGDYKFLSQKESSENYNENEGGVEVADPVHVGPKLGAAIQSGLNAHPTINRILSKNF